MNLALLTRLSNVAFGCFHIQLYEGNCVPYSIHQDKKFSSRLNEKTQLDICLTSSI